MRQEPVLPTLPKLIFACKYAAAMFTGHPMLILVIARFKHAWADIDTKGTGYIQKEDVAKLLRKFTGRFSFRIYDDQHRVDNIIRHGFQSFDKQRSSYTKSPSAKSPAMKSPGKSSPAVKSGHSSLTPGEYDINVQEINRLLGKMDVDQVRKRRLEYNLYYKVRFNAHCVCTCCY